jgi:hypothetical protein
LPSVCLVPRLDFSAIPISISAVSLESISTYILLDFKVAKWVVSSLTHSKKFFEYCKYLYFYNHDSNIATDEFFVISTETACWEIARK